MARKPFNMVWPPEKTCKRELPEEIEDAIEIALISNEKLKDRNSDEMSI